MEVRKSNPLLVQVHLLEGSMSPQTHLVLTFPVLEHIIRINILSMQQNQHMSVFQQ